MDSPEEDDQMRQMMGFSSFGGKKPKPKHKPRQEGASSAPGHGTSTNLTPLGNRPIPAANIPPSNLPPRSPIGMGTYEQSLDGESSQWVAARLPGPSPFDDNNGTNVDAPVTNAISSEPTATPPNQQQSTNPEAHTFLEQFSVPTPSFNAQAEPFHPPPTYISQSPINSSATTVTSTTNPATLPAKPPPPTNATTTYSKNDIRSDPTYWSTTQSASLPHSQNKSEDAIGYVSPWTGAEMTRKELREYGAGKQVVKSDGEVVLTFFKPSFVDDGIWDRLERRDGTGNSR